MPTKFVTLCQKPLLPEYWMRLIGRINSRQPLRTRRRGILEMQRLALKSEEEKGPVMEVLHAYLRVHVRDPYRRAVLLARDWGPVPFRFRSSDPPGDVRAALEALERLNGDSRLKPLSSFMRGFRPALHLAPRQ